MDFKGLRDRLRARKADAGERLALRRTAARDQLEAKGIDAAEQLARRKAVRAERNASEKARKAEQKTADKAEREAERIKRQKVRKQRNRFALVQASGSVVGCVLWSVLIIAVIIAGVVWIFRGLAWVL
ncbi:MAG: hypothetical protein OXK16_15640 [bacterium]|nr:hypothetical protein [bacterium]